MIRVMIAAFACLCSLMVSAQEDPVLMSINGHDIHRSEFEYIYNKNSAEPNIEKKSLDEYVELFVDFKLKVYKAMELGIDTTESFRNELEGYRKQLAKIYMTDSEAEERAAREYYDKMAQRSIPGSVRVSQIIMRMPQNVTARRQRECEVRMDSIYNVLLSSPDKFNALKQRFSDDKSSFDIEPLQATEEFENTVVGMAVGEISKPFYTPNGLHIVRVEAVSPLPQYEKIKKEIINKLSGNGNKGAGTQAAIERLKAELSFKENSRAVDKLLKEGYADDWLFEIDGQRYSTERFNLFAASYPRSRKVQYNAFVTKSILEYEDSKLEKRHDEFRLLMQEYREGMLMFEISDREVWSRVANDKEGLKEYFATHRSDYKWDEYKYKGVVVRCKEEKLGKEIKRKLKKVDYSQWSDSIAKLYDSDGSAVAEYGLFSCGDNDIVDLMVYHSNVTMTADGYPFAYVYGKKQKGPANDEEAGEALVSDYRDYLEKTWIDELRRDSRVEIKQEVLKTVNNH